MDDTLWESLLTLLKHVASCPHCAGCSNLVKTFLELHELNIAAIK